MGEDAERIVAEEGQVATGERAREVVDSGLRVGYGGGGVESGGDSSEIGRWEIDGRVSGEVAEFLGFGLPKRTVDDELGERGVGAEAAGERQRGGVGHGRVGALDGDDELVGQAEFLQDRGQSVGLIDVGRKEVQDLDVEANAGEAG